MEFTQFDKLSEKIRTGSYKNPGFLLELLACVQEYTKEQMERIREDVWREMYKPGHALGTVMTVLSKKGQIEDLEQAGFCRMDKRLPCMSQIGIDLGLLRRLNKNADKVILGYGFLECGYGEFCRRTQSGVVYRGSLHYRDGKESEFGYQLIFSEKLLKKERILTYCGELYQITAPVVFSPFTWRLVKIQVQEGLAVDDLEKIDRVDLKPEENGLDQILSMDKEVVWNVKIQDQDLDMTSKKGSLLGEEKHYIYAFDGCDDNQYIVPLEKSTALFRVCRDKDKIRFQYTENYTGRFAKITVKTILKKPENACCFSNSHQGNERKTGGLEQETKVRLRSEGDIWFALNQHGAQLGLELEKISREKCSGYREYETYREGSPYAAVEQLSLKNRGSVYLYFRSRNNTIFADDYMNYLCGYLETMYPDFVWRGGYR